ncbi:MAG TPA: hypothetical protein VJ738_10870 [Steroidobacteraceae bacterium]|nr:hypothetical protein [Steroidobacteraceae bacterium]
MNAIQKATVAASALAITLLGAALVTAPLAFARPQTVVAHQACTTQMSRHVECYGVKGETGLVALNRS